MYGTVGRILGSGTDRIGRWSDPPANVPTTVVFFELDEANVADSNLTQEIPAIAQG